MESKEQGKSPHYILNTHLNGVPIGDSHDHIVAAMESYASLRVSEAVEATNKELAHLKEWHEPSMIDFWNEIQFQKKDLEAKDKEIAELKSQLKQANKEYVRNGSINEWKEFAEHMTQKVNSLQESIEELQSKQRTWEQE